MHLLKHLKFSFRTEIEANEMVQQMKSPVVKPGKLSSIPGNHVLGEEN